MENNNINKFCKKVITFCKKRLIPLCIILQIIFCIESIFILKRLDVLDYIIIPTIELGTLYLIFNVLEYLCNEIIKHDEKEIITITEEEEEKDKVLKKEEQIKKELKETYNLEVQVKEDKPLILERKKSK